MPPPVAPDDPKAWYTPATRSQTEIFPGVVATITARGNSFRYHVREPPLSGAEQAALEDNSPEKVVQRPLTREGLRERFHTDLSESVMTADDTRSAMPVGQRRRLQYHKLKRHDGFGEATPLALDTRIEVADVATDPVVVHTERFAPVHTEITPAETYRDRFVSERLASYTVSVYEFEIPVVIYRDNRIGGDAFPIKYAVREPPLTDAERALIATCKERIWDGSGQTVIEDQAEFVVSRARQELRRINRQRRAGIISQVRALLPGKQPTAPDQHWSDDRLNELVYYVFRAFIGEGPLTVPLRDPRLEDIEANRVEERIKVVPRGTLGINTRMPTNLAFDDRRTFVDVVTQLAAADGVELTAANPTAKVNLDIKEQATSTTIRCAVALPTVSDQGPHVSIRKQATDTLTPVDLIEQGTLSTELVALLWQLYQHQCVVLFAGPTGTGKTTLLNAHTPFIKFDTRPVAIDEGAREVRLPHETGVALSTTQRFDTEAQSGRSLGHLITECNYLNPDTEIIGELNSPESFRSFGNAISTGHGIIGTTHAEDVETLANRVVNQGLSPYLLTEIDLVVFTRQFDGQRYVGEAIEFLEADAFETVSGRGGQIDVDNQTVYWNTVAQRDRLGNGNFAYTHPRLAENDHGSPTQDQIGDRLDQSAFETDNWGVADNDTSGDQRPTCDMRVLHRIAEQTDRPVQAVEAEYHRKLRYVRYLVEHGIDDVDALFEFLADLRTNEAATVERIRG